MFDLTIDQVVIFFQRNQLKGRSPVDCYNHWLIVAELALAAEFGLSLAQWNDFHALQPCTYNEVPRFSPIVQYEMRYFGNGERKARAGSGSRFTNLTSAKSSLISTPEKVALSTRRRWKWIKSSRM
jgi:hypothetical protein